MKINIVEISSKRCQKLRKRLDPKYGLSEKERLATFKMLNKELRFHYYLVNNKIRSFSLKEDLQKLIELFEVFKERNILPPIY